MEWLGLVWFDSKQTHTHSHTPFTGFPVIFIVAVVVVTSIMIIVTFFGNQVRLKLLPKFHITFNFPLGENLSAKGFNFGSKEESSAFWDKRQTLSLIQFQRKAEKNPINALALIYTSFECNTREKKAESLPFRQNKCECECVLFCRKCHLFLWMEHS